MSGYANRLISKANQMLSRLSGGSARRAENTASVLSSINYKNQRAIPGAAVLRAKRIAKVERGRSTQTRLKFAVGMGAGVGSGMLGLHKYHQNQDNKILQRIDRMGKEQV